MDSNQLKSLSDVSLFLGSTQSNKLCLCQDNKKPYKKNPSKYLNNIEFVKSKIEEIEKKDKLRNFQPPVDGKIIMQTFNIKPSKLVGEIKFKIREAILNGEINNNKKEAENYMYKIGKELKIY